MNRAITPFAAVLGALALAGCNGVSSRVQEKAAVYASLSPSMQKDLRDGIVHPGDTPDMVYIALGKPSVVQDYDNDPTLPAGAVPPGSKDPVTIWYYHIHVAGDPKYDPTPGSEGIDPLNGIPIEMGYLKTRTLVVFRHGAAIKVRRYL